MKKEEIIERYGEEAWAKILAQKRAYYKEHKEEEIARVKKYREEHPEAQKKYYEDHREERKAIEKRWREVHIEQVKALNREHCRAGGKYYDRQLEYLLTGLTGEKHRIRAKHGKQYRPYKNIIAPESQIHHEWVPNTAEYRGIALVEKDQHQYGIVDVIEILDGKITLLSEEQKRNGGV